MTHVAKTQGMHHELKEERAIRRNPNLGGLESYVRSLRCCKPTER